MTIEEARQICGKQPYWALRKMVKALKMHRWLNTDEENKRLHAAQLLLRNSLDEN